MHPPRLARSHTIDSISRRSVLAGAVGLGVSMTSFGVCATEMPRRGGNLRVAILGGGSADSLDAHYNLSQPDAARVLCLYQPLRRVRHGNKVDNLLAESMESNRDATQWTIRLRQGITFHNGKPLKAEDVIYTFRRVTDPKAPLLGAPELGPMDRDSFKVLDERTLRVTMRTPFSIFDQAVADDINLGIVPVGYDPRRPVGIAILEGIVDQVGKYLSGLDPIAESFRQRSDLHLRLRGVELVAHGRDPFGDESAHFQPADDQGLPA